MGSGVALEAGVALGANVALGAGVALGIAGVAVSASEVGVSKGTGVWVDPDAGRTAVGVGPITGELQAASNASAAAKIGRNL